ncbi:MAG TPA: nuclear transport factor 2 family protein [Mycobacterium sp.]|nr:nuclear transport factor 2 family protein [Mycobacterium sp.]HTX95369.1 nuclear transport factor 2 family protein [Mycobacterium sp.]
MRSTEKVTRFWDEVWNAHDLDAADQFLADNVVLAAGRQEFTGKENVKNWIKGFFEKVNELEVDDGETFQNQDGTRVTSRWVLLGTNNGLFGTRPNGEQIALSGIAVFAVGDEGKFERVSVEQDSFEQYRRLMEY